LPKSKNFWHNATSASLLRVMQDEQRQLSMPAAAWRWPQQLMTCYMPSNLGSSGKEKFAILGGKSVR
jgi:hypothetical protein